MPYPQERRFVNDEDFNTAAGLRNMSRREREEVLRRAQRRSQDPYSFPRQRSRANATIGNMYAAEEADWRARERDHGNTSVYGVAGWDPRMTTGKHGVRNVRWRDQYAAPEPPRINPRNAEYYLDRAHRPRNTCQDNYNDASRYINGRHPARRTEPIGSRHDPREYAGLHLRFGLNGDRNRDPATSRWDRVRNWF